MRGAPPIYALPIRLLHWLTVILVAWLFALAIGNRFLSEALPDLGETFVQVHINLGFLVLLATLVRLVVKIGVPAPGSSWQTGKWPPVLARTVHGLLYAGLLTIPVAGYVKLAALGYEIRLFGMIALPGLSFDPSLARYAREVHANAAWCLGLLILLHGAAALFHRRIDGTSVLHRMALWSRAPWVRVAGTVRHTSW